MSIVETGVASESCINCKSFMTKTVRPPCHHFVCSECVQIQGHIFPRLASKGFYVCYECGEKVILPPSYFLILQSGDRQPLPLLFQERIIQGWNKTGLDRYPVLRLNQNPSSTHRNPQSSMKLSPLPTDIHAPLFYDSSAYPQPQFASWTGSFEKPKEFFLPPRPATFGHPPPPTTIVYHTTCSVQSNPPSRPGSLEPRRTPFEYRVEEKPRESSLNPNTLVRREPPTKDPFFGNPATDIPNSHIAQSYASFRAPTSSHPPPRDSDLSFAPVTQPERTDRTLPKLFRADSQTQTDSHMPAIIKTEASSFPIANVCPQKKREAPPAQAVFASQTEADWKAPASKVQLTVDNRFNQIIIIPPFKKLQSENAQMAAPISFSPIDPKSHDYERNFVIPEEMEKYVYNPVSSGREQSTRRQQRPQQKASNRGVFASMNTEQGPDYNEEETGRAELQRNSPSRLQPAKDLPNKTNQKARRPIEFRGDTFPMPPNQRRPSEDQVKDLQSISGVHSVAEDNSVAGRDSREENDHCESEVQTKLNHNKSKKGHARQDSSLQNKPASPDPELTILKAAAKKAKDLEQENLLRTLLEKEVERYREREEKDREARIRKEEEDRARELKERDRRENDLRERERLDRERRDKEESDRRERLEADRADRDKREKDWQDKLEAWRREEVERSRQASLEKAAREQKEREIQQEISKLEAAKLDLQRAEETASRRRQEEEDRERVERELKNTQEREQKEREWLEKLEAAKREIVQREEEQLRLLKLEWEAQQQKESEKRRQEHLDKEKQLLEEMGRLEETRKELQRIKEDMLEKARLEKEERDRVLKKQEEEELLVKSTSVAISLVCPKKKTVFLEMKLSSPQESMPSQGIEVVPLKRAGQARPSKGKNQKKRSAGDDEPADRPPLAEPPIPVEYPEYQTNEYLRSMIKKVPLTRISASEGNLLISKGLENHSPQVDDPSSHRNLSQKDFEYRRTGQVDTVSSKEEDRAVVIELHQEAEEMRWKLKRDLHLQKERKRLEEKEELIRQQLAQTENLEQATRQGRIRNPPLRDGNPTISKQQPAKPPRTDVDEFRATILDKLLVRATPDQSREKELSYRQGTFNSTRPSFHHVDIAKVPREEPAEQLQAQSNSQIRDSFYRTKSIMRSELDRHPNLAVPRFSDEPEIDPTVVERARLFAKSDTFQSLKQTAQPSRSDRLTVWEETITTSEKPFAPLSKRCSKSGRLQPSYRSIDSRSNRPVDPQPLSDHCCHSFLIKPAEASSATSLKKNSSAMITLESGSVLRGLLKESRCEDHH